MNKFLKVGMFAILSLGLIGCTDLSTSNEKVTAGNQKVENITELSIGAVGDLLIHNSVYDAARTKDGYDFTEQFAHMKDKASDIDYLTVGLEVPIGKKDFSNYPSFRAPWDVVKGMRDVLGGDLFFTATNHTLDKGFSGLKTTLECLDELGVKSTGSYATKEDSENIFIEEINGAKIAFLAYTYGTNGYPLPKENTSAVNLISKDKIVSDSKKAEELGADFIVVKCHFGNEYEVVESKEQRELVEFIFSETSSQLVIGDHPHVVQNIEEMTVMRNGKEKKGAVIYSLGNFISGQNKQFRDTGILAKINIKIDKDNSDNNEVKSVEYTPVFVDRNVGAGLKSLRVVDINKAIEDFENNSDKLISSEEYKKMKNYKNYYREKLLRDGFVYER